MLLIILVIIFVISLINVSGLELNIDAVDWSSYAPEQIHLTFHSDPTKLVVSWTSFETHPFSSLINYGSSLDDLSNSNSGSYLTYENDYCKDNSTRSIHSVEFSVESGKTVYYKVSSNDGKTWSNIYETVGISRDYPQSVALWGDMGINCDLSSVDQITSDLLNGYHSYAIHFGDTAYNMNDECGAVGDDFLNAAMSYSTRSPIVYTNGNHESGPYKRYHEYVYRLATGQNQIAEASGSNNNRYFLWTVGPVTYFAFDPDAWIYPPVYDLAQPQFEWLDEVLSKVDRTQTPWLIGTAHRALYCTKTYDRECNGEALTLRYGFRKEQYGLESLFQKYGVDIYFSGHTHHYERTYPVRDGQATQYDYIDPKATVHVQSGIAGVNGYDSFDAPQQPWEAFRDTTFSPSYSRLIIHNSTHATVQQLFSANGTVLDEFVIIQNNHGEF